MLREFLAKYAIGIGLVLGLLWAWARWSGQRHVVLPFQEPDPLWIAAVRTARNTLPLMRELHSSYGSELHVKYPLLTASGQIEHVWGKIVDLGGETLKVTLEIPTLNALPSQPPFVINVGDLEDWQLVLPDGNIRGGFTTQAQIAMAKREGRGLPPAFSQTEGCFIDQVQGAA